MNVDRGLVDQLVDLRRAFLLLDVLVESREEGAHANDFHRVATVNLHEKRDDDQVDFLSIRHDLSSLRVDQRLGCTQEAVAQFQGQDVQLETMRDLDALVVQSGRLGHLSQIIIDEGRVEDRLERDTLMILEIMLACLDGEFVHFHRLDERHLMSPDDPFNQRHNRNGRQRSCQFLWMFLAVMLERSRPVNDDVRKQWVFAEDAIGEFEPDLSQFGLWVISEDSLRVVKSPDEEVALLVFIGNHDLAAMGEGRDALVDGSMFEASEVVTFSQDVTDVLQSVEYIGSVLRLVTVGEQSFHVGYRQRTLGVHHPAQDGSGGGGKLMSREDPVYQILNGWFGLLEALESLHNLFIALQVVQDVRDEDGHDKGPSRNSRNTIQDLILFGRPVMEMVGV